MILYTINVYIYICIVYCIYIWYKYAILRTLGRFHKFITFPSFGASEFIQNKILWSAAWVARSCCHKTIQLQTHPWNKNSYSMLHLASCNPPKKRCRKKDHDMLSYHSPKMNWVYSLGLKPFIFIPSIHAPLFLQRSWGWNHITIFTKSPWKSPWWNPQNRPPQNPQGEIDGSKPWPPATRSSDV